MLLHSIRLAPNKNPCAQNLDPETASLKHDDRWALNTISKTLTLVMQDNCSSTPLDSRGVCVEDMQGGRNKRARHGDKEGAREQER